MDDEVPYPWHNFEIRGRISGNFGRQNTAKKPVIRTIRRVWGRATTDIMVTSQDSVRRTGERRSGVNK